MTKYFKGRTFRELSRPHKHTLAYIVPGDTVLVVRVGQEMEQEYEVSIIRRQRLEGEPGPGATASKPTVSSESQPPKGSMTFQKAINNYQPRVQTKQSLGEVSHSNHNQPGGELFFADNKFTSLCATEAAGRVQCCWAESQADMQCACL